MKGEKLSLLQRCIKWREANIKEKQFILILSFLVGIFTAFAALILKFFIHQIQNFLTDNFNATEANYLYLVYPVVGIFLAGWFVRNIVKDDISHGVTKILYAISRRQGRIKRHNIWSSTIASAITIGFGGWRCGGNGYPDCRGRDFGRKAHPPHRVVHSERTGVVQAYVGSK